METVTHHGRETAYRVADRREGRTPFLCVHGSGGSHAVWKAQLARLSRRRVVAIDLSGHGESDDVATDPGPETLSAYVDDVVAVARETDAAALCGNSLGGAVVLQLALERDLALRSLVLVGTGAKLSVRPDLLRRLEEDFDGAVSALHEPDLLFHGGDERALERSRETMRATGCAVTSRDFRTCDAFDVRDRLGEIDVPALALTGEHDRLTPPWYHEYLADHLPDATWDTIEGAAHLSMIERPDAFNDRVARFLSEE